MKIKEGLIPAVMGTAVAATGYALKKTNLPDSYSNGIIGFGLANIVLGSVGMISQNIDRDNIMNRMSKAVPFR